MGTYPAPKHKKDAKNLKSTKIIQTDALNLRYFSIFGVNLAPMHFDIRILSVHKHLIEVKCTFTANNDLTSVRIPFWRPGRYEPGNFPRNYIGFAAFSKGDPIHFRKVTPHLWTVNTPNGQPIELKYTLYAAELTAGNTYVDSDALLLNPVNSLVYLPGREDEPITLHIELPEEWMSATSLAIQPSSGSLTQHRFSASGMQELMDSPVLAAPDLLDFEYEVNNIPFHVHISGFVPTESPGVLADFKAFTETQIAAFGSFPVSEYHFLFLFLPKKVRHGVEHEKSTVIIMGPADSMGQEDMYHSLLEISSHELYHTWHVKYMRPTDWTPYDFDGPNYSRMAYIVEGITTYMGDWMLWQSGIFDDDEFFAALSRHWQTHKDNQGRHNLSLADASIDTWTDGYGGGAPERRVSIYTEGALLAFVCDVWLLDASQGNFGLWMVMRQLYQHTNPAQGYTEDDFWQALADAAPHKPWTHLRNEVVEGRGALEQYVLEAAALVGLQAAENENPVELDMWWGASVVMQAEQGIVTSVAPGSPAESCGLWYGDRIATINGVQAATFLTSVSSEVLRTQPANLVVLKGYKTLNTELIPDGQRHKKRHTLSKAAAGSSGWLETWKNAVNSMV